MNIRKATKDDFIQLGKLYRQVDSLHSIAHPDIFQLPITDPRSGEYLQKILEADYQILIVAEEQGSLIGMAKAEIVSATDFPLFVKRSWLLIGTIVVNKNNRGKGIGKELLLRLYDFAKEKNVSEIELSVYAFNEAARNFYKKQGFVDIKTRMRKKI